jgi:hypothetical protein
MVLCADTRRWVFMAWMSLFAACDGWRGGFWGAQPARLMRMAESADSLDTEMPALRAIESVRESRSFEGLTPGAHTLVHGTANNSLHRKGHHGNVEQKGSLRKGNRGRSLRPEKQGNQTNCRFASHCCSAAIGRVRRQRGFDGDSFSDPNGLLEGTELGNPPQCFARCRCPVFLSDDL